MPQLNMYTPIHKGLRNLLFATSLRAGSTDWNHEADLAGLRQRVDHLLQVLRLHVRNEETYAHPLIADRLVGVHRKLESDHRLQEALLDDLESFFSRAQAAGPAPRTQLGLECYRVLNRFLALYLPHPDEEETRVMPAINEAYTPEEVLAVYLEILRNQAEPDLLADVDMMFPAMTDDEVVVTHAERRLLDVARADGEGRAARRTRHGPGPMEAGHGPPGSAGPGALTRATLREGGNQDWDHHPFPSQ